MIQSVLGNLHGKSPCGKILNHAPLLHKTQYTKLMSNASLQTTGHLQTEKKSNEIDPIHLYTCFTHPFQTAERFSKHVVPRDHIPCEHPIEHPEWNGHCCCISWIVPMASDLLPYFTYSTIMAHQATTSCVGHPIEHCPSILYAPMYDIHVNEDCCPEIY